MVEPHSSVDRNFLALASKLLAYEPDRRLKARHALSEVFIENFDHARHKAYLRDRIADKLKDGFKLETVGIQ